jgi:hypothetical protein
MAAPQKVLRAWVRRAKRAAGNDSAGALAEVLEAIGDALLEGPTGGAIVISTSEAGGSVSFQLPPGHTPLELAALNEDAIAWAVESGIISNADLTIPAGRRIMRMRASFSKAVTS